MEPRIPRIAVGGVVLDVRGAHPTVVLVRRKHAPRAGEWSLPGGRVEHGELLADALRREMREECGLDVRVGDLIEVVEIVRDGMHYVIMDYACEIVGGTLRPGDDASEASWIPVLDLREHGVTADVARVVAKALTTD